MSGRRRAEPTGRWPRGWRTWAAAVVVAAVAGGGVGVGLGLIGRDRGTPGTTAVSESPAGEASEAPLPEARVTLPEGDLDSWWFGDSLVSGAGASDVEHRFVTLVARAMQRRAGWTTAGAALPLTDRRGLMRAVRDAPDPDVIVLSFGYDTSSPPAVFGRRLERLAVVLEERAPRAILMCVGAWRTEAKAAPYDRWITRVCEQFDGVPVPVATLFDRDDSRGPARRRALDAVGTLAPAGPRAPNDTGHAQIAARLLLRMGIDPVAGRAHGSGE
ncbi:SGNH/GDSL hydrolase family protein [Nocardioides sp.]|uniref:SGNH/GDSL hydrolase family protein n=1 Tax=Nocardioides sp. TaxID=35761 RepID=UPI0035142CA4